MPEQPRTTAQVDSKQRVQAARRARRGLVAGYIHELSGRHVAARDELRNIKVPVAKTA